MVEGRGERRMIQETGQPGRAGFQGLRQRVLFAESAQRQPRNGVWVGPDFKGGEGSACR